jgi:hypothetical protein
LVFIFLGLWYNELKDKDSQMSIVNPIQPINIFSNMLHSILDVATVDNSMVLNHIVLSLIKSIKEYQQSLLEIQNLVEFNPDFARLSGYEEFYENFGASLDDFERLLELMTPHKEYSAEFATLYRKIDVTYTALVEMVDTVSVQEALYLDNKLLS